LLLGLLTGSLCWYRSAALRDPPSFPTRRSSDLGVLAEPGRGALVDERRARHQHRRANRRQAVAVAVVEVEAHPARDGLRIGEARSEEHTSELQSRENLVCRLLLEKKNRQTLQQP